MLRIVIVEGILEAISPFHFGSGRVSILGELETAKTITEDEEILYIPSTAIRGLLRIHSEKLARARSWSLWRFWKRKLCFENIK